MALEQTLRRKSKLGRRENIAGLLFISIPVISLLVFTLIPIILSFYISFTNWSGYNAIWEAETVGWRNYSDIFTGMYKEEFFGAVLNTLWMMLSVPIGLILALLLALALNKKIAGSEAFRVIYYIPVVANVVAITIIFRQLFVDDGTINGFLKIFSIAPVSWLHGKNTSKIVIVVLLVWRNLGYSLLLFLAGLQGIAKEYYEAAKLDGAGSFKMFIKLTIPFLRPVTFFMIVTGIMGGLQIFTEPNVMFNYTFGKGPEKGTQTILVFLYYNYSRIDKLGIASAVAWVLAAMVFIVTGTQFYINSKRGD